jgi:hypothetical protein
MKFQVKFQVKFQATTRGDSIHYLQLGKRGEKGETARPTPKNATMK